MRLLHRCKDTPVTLPSNSRQVKITSHTHQTAAIHKPLRQAQSDSHTWVYGLFSIKGYLLIFDHFIPHLTKPL